MRLLDQLGRWLGVKSNPLVVTGQTTEGAYKFLEEGPEGIEGIDYFDLSPGNEKELPVNGWTINIRNMGTVPIFYGPKSERNTRNWPVLPGGKSGPISDEDSLYFYLPSDAPSNVRVYYSFMGVL